MGKNLFKKKSGEKNPTTLVVCITLIPLSLGTKLSSNEEKCTKKTFSTIIYINLYSMAFLTVRTHFYSYLQNRKVLGFNNLMTLYLRKGPLWWVVLYFVILNAVLCALKCIFLLVNNLIRHISTLFFFFFWYKTASTQSDFLFFEADNFVFSFNFFSCTFLNIPLYLNKFIFKVMSHASRVSTVNNWCVKKVQSLNWHYLGVMTLSSG